VILVISAGSLAVLPSSMTKSQKNFELLRGLPSVWLSSINDRIFCGDSTWCWCLTKERSFFYVLISWLSYQHPSDFSEVGSRCYILWYSIPMLAPWYEYISSSGFPKSTMSKSIEEESSLTLDSMSCSCVAAS
jgi:hypothetical protein